MRSIPDYSSWSRNDLAAADHDQAMVTAQMNYWRDVADGQRAVSGAGDSLTDALEEFHEIARRLRGMNPEQAPAFEASLEIRNLLARSSLLALQAERTLGAHRSSTSPERGSSDVSA